MKDSKGRHVAAERVQTGVRMERRMVKVLKALAEYLDVSLGELLEIIVLQSFEGAPGFSGGTLRRIQEFKKIYGMEFTLAQARMALFVDE